MKKSYKLLGVVWDRLPLPGTVPKLFSGKQWIRDFSEPPDLFDCGHVVRQIDCSWMLQVESELKFARVIEIVNQCDEIFLRLDSPPRHSFAALRLYVRRALQIYHRIAQTSSCKVIGIICVPRIQRLVLSVYAE